MSQDFIDKVRALIMSNISDEKFGKKSLASQLGLSPSQTLRKVKAATGKPVNRYIRELRLEKAAKLIKNTDDTIAEISYQVGFGSPSYFNKAFVKYYGIAPGEYKTKSTSLSELAAKNTKNKFHTLFSNKKLLVAVLLAMLLVISYFFIQPLAAKNKPLENSIAVLPFLDLSPNDTQWFSDGVSDNIVHSLAQIKDLTVISFTSSSTYRETEKQIPKIAKELGVSYILEGSVTLYGDRIRIIVQLINKNNEHMWSKEYMESFDDIITIQNNVADEVMKQLEVTLSPSEVITLNKYPTQNMEAYSLHLKGRLVNDSRRKKDLELNIELNKKAIALDSTFAEAYAEVAHSYSQLASYWGFNNWRKDAIDSFVVIELAHKYADSAISINPNTFKAWTVKANLSMFNDWDKANKLYKKALTLNPNDALIHFQYGLYFRLRPNPDIKKYLKHLTISQSLNPFSQNQTRYYLNALIFNNKIKEAENFFKMNEFQLTYDQTIFWETKIVAYKNKDWTEIIPFLKSKIEKDPNNDYLYCHLAQAYNGIMNDDITAIEYYKKAYEIDSTESYTARYYLHQLIEGNKIDEAKKLMESSNYQSVVEKPLKLGMQWFYYYNQGKSEKAFEISKDSLLTNQYSLQVLTYALLGDRKKVDSINKRHPRGNSKYNYLFWRGPRTILYAVLKDKDSMYYYLESLLEANRAKWVHGRREMDPYRNEERYKAFLKKWYLPVPEE